MCHNGVLSRAWAQSKNTACHKTKDWTFSGAKAWWLARTRHGNMRGKSEIVWVASWLAWEYERCISLLFIFFLLDLVVFRLRVIRLNWFLYFWWAFIPYDLGPIHPKVSTFCMVVNQHWKPDWLERRVKLKMCEGTRRFLQDSHGHCRTWRDLEGLEVTCYVIETGWLK